MSRKLENREISARLERFRELLPAHRVDSALLVEKMDLYYLSGTDQDAHLWVPTYKTPLLMVRKSIERAKQDSPLQAIVPLSSLSNIPEQIYDHAGTLPTRLGLEMDVLPTNLYLTYQKLFPGTEMVDISPLIRAVRMIKSAYEIGRLTKAAEMGDKMFGQVPTFLEESRTETDLALRLEAFYRKEGHPGLVRARGFNRELFYGHVMSGKSAAMPSSSPGPTGGKGPGPFYSQGAGRGRIGRREPILVDLSSNVDGYVADQARIFSLGKLSKKFYQAHEVMCEVQDALCRQGRPGVSAGDLYNLAMEIVERAGFAKGFMGYPDPVPFVGHGVGLELDEWPIIGRNSETLLEEGMVIALEPKFIFPGQGVVGIENNVVVTANGMKKLNCFPDAIYTC